MSKRVASVQISNRNPVGHDDSSSGDEHEDGGNHANVHEIQQRKISRPQAPSQRFRQEGRTVPALGNLFAGLPTNPFATTTKSDDFESNIRGLNRSFVESAKLLLEKTPAADFTRLFAQYSKHLAAFSPAPAQVPVSMPAPSVSTQPTIEPKAVFSSGPQEPSMAAADSKPVVAEAKQAPVMMADAALPSGSGPFFGARTVNAPFAAMAPPSDAESQQKPSTFAPPSPFSFATSKPTETATASAPVSASPFAFGEGEQESLSRIDAPSLFGTSKAEEPAAKFSFGSEKKPETAPATLPASTFPFGSVNEAPSAPKKAESVAPAPFSFSALAKPDGKAPAPFAAFAKTDAPPASFSFSTTTKPDASPAPFSFTAKTDAAPAPFSFAAKTDAAPAPFSFSAKTDTPPALFSFSAPSTDGASVPSSLFPPFGASTLAPLPPFSLNLPAASSAFSFAAPQSGLKTDAGGQSGGDDDEIPAEEAESFTLTRTNSEQLKTGVGEENETCQHEERCKIFLMDREKGWIDLGVGIFKINRYNDEVGRARILCRTEGSGKVILNSLITSPGTEATHMAGKKEVALLTIGTDGKPAKYLVRVKTLDQALALQAALATEIEHVTAHKK